MEPLVILNSKRKYLRHLATSVGFIGASVFVILQASTNGGLWVGWGGVIIFGAGTVVFAFELLDSRPRVVINEIGIEDRKLGVGLIPWSEITGAYIKSMKRNDFICLLVRNPSIWTHKFSPAQQVMVKANLKLGFSELNVILGGTDANSAQVLQLVLQYIAARR